MSRPKRANGAGAVYIKHGSYYGRWLTPAGRTNRRLGPVRRPGTSSGLTRTQAEKRLRELMRAAAIPVAPDPDRTVKLAGRAFVEHLEALGRSKSHIETVESHLRVHLEPFFGEKPIDRIGEAEVTRLLSSLRRSGLKAKTSRNILSTLHSVFELAIRRGWMVANPCKLVDAPAVEPSTDVAFFRSRSSSGCSQAGSRRTRWARSSARFT